MRYKVTVAYDGTYFYGWQTQDNQICVQEEIEKYLSMIMNTNIKITASGRTDKGVHALGQVFHFDAEKKIPCEKLKYALNNFLSSSIRIQTIEWIDDVFHARFSAKSKVYRYIFTKELDNPFVVNYKSLVKGEIDVSLMKEAAQYLIGEHDFRSFASAKIDARKSCNRTIYQIQIEQKDEDIVLTFEGNGFLRHMVRILSQVLLEVGKKNISIHDMLTMLEKKDKDICRYKAIANGLYLVCVRY